MGVDEDVTYTAGVAGFIVFFFLAIALWLLVRNMNARLRRMRYYAEQEAAAAGQRSAGELGRPGDPGQPGQPGRPDEGGGYGPASSPGAPGDPAGPGR